MTNLAYPLGDLLLLSAVFGVFSLTRWRPGRRWLLLGLGVLATALADAIYLFQSASDTYVEGSWIDILWPAALLLIASSAWAVDRSRPEVDGKTLLAVPSVCAVVGIGVLVYDHFDRVNLLAVGLATATLLAVVVRLAMTFRENRRLYELTRHESVTDALTGLGNRRKLLSDLEHLFAEPEIRPTLLMIFDLDGFKGYNDTFGHPAGDALLARLGAKLAAVPTAGDGAYRLGGDEFCLVVPLVEGEAEPVIDRACAALSERRVGFEIGSSFGAVLLPEEAFDASKALHVADERLYAQKHSRRMETDRTMDALLEALSLREPDLPMHLDSVGSLARRDRPAARAAAGRARRARARGAAPRPRQARRAGRDPAQGRAARRAASGRSCASTRWSASGSSAPRPLSGTWRRSCARRTSAGTATATRTASPVEEIPRRVPDHLRLRRVHGDDRRPPVPAALERHEALAELERVAGTQFDPAVVAVLAAHVRDESASSGRASGGNTA